MVCIYCGSKTKIINSRQIAKSGQIWRRHRCQECHATFTTTEDYQLNNALLVEHSNQQTEPFIKEKLFISIHQAIDHLKNNEETANYLTQTVINRLFKSKPLKPILTTKNIYITVVYVLRRYDAASAIRYASIRTSMPLSNDVKRFLRA